MPKIQGENINWARPRCPIEEVLFEVPNLPVSMSCVDESFASEKDFIADMQFGVDPVSGTIQSMNRMPTDLVYLEPHNACVGKTWQRHHQAFAEFILRQPLENKVIYEIGGGDGYLASLCIDKVKRWHIIEPNPPANRFEHFDVVYHKGYYPEVPIVGADVVVHSNLLEHIRDPRKFLNDLMNVPVQMMSVPQFEYAMNLGNPSILNFEHENALTCDVLRQLFHVCGYNIADMVNHNNFTWFYEIHKVSPAVTNVLVGDSSYASASTLLLTYKDKLTEEASRLQAMLEGVEGPFYFFGAHIFYTMLRSLGLTAAFDGLLDNSPLKIGKRLYGTDLMVSSPEIIQVIKEPVIVVPKTPYQAEMVEQVKSLNLGAAIVC